MKIFQNKNLFKKLMIIFLIILIFSFCMPKQSKAVSIGGKLLQPITDLILSLSDGVYGIAHKIILQQDTSLIHIDFSESVWEKVATVAIFILVAVATIVAIIATGGAIAALIPAIAGVVSVGLGTTLVVGVGTGLYAASVFNSKAFPDDELVLPLYSISPEEIFSNDLVIFDVDFFNPEQKKALTDENGEVLKDDNGNDIELESTSRKLRSTVSNWYNVLRDISLVVLLSILVYIGIRILISSTANDSAKYKQMLTDWVVAICLLFTMQYIMSFSNLIVEKVTDVIKDINYSNKTIQILPDKKGKVSERLKKDYGYTDDQIEFVEDESGERIKNDDGEDLIYWHTNLMGIARLNAQMGRAESSNYAGYTIMFMVLVFFTLFFIFTYLKRVIYMAFLTLIAPLVAMTYPLDKMGDAKAQAFNMWFKEYIFNLLIQPMHLILYTILVTSAFELASKNMIYSLVALGFMIPAEKLLRKFFGFEKADTPGLLAGPAGAAATMGMMNKLLSKGGSKGGKSSTGGAGKNSENDEKFDIKMKDDLPDAELPESHNVDKSNNNLIEKDGDDTKEIDRDQEFIDAEKNYNDRENNKFDDANKVDEFDKRDTDDINNKFDDSIPKDGIDEQNPKNRKMSQRILGGAKNVAIKGAKGSADALEAANASRRYYSENLKDKMRNNLKNRLSNGKPIKFVLRTAGGIATGVTAAALGLSAGIVSGDPTKAVQFTTAAAIGGYNFGKGTTNNVTNALSVDGTNKVFQRNMLRR